MPLTPHASPRPARALAVVVVALLLVPLLPTAPARADVVVRRAFGPDRITTAVEASADFRDRATDALLTTAFAFPDALAAGALAHRLDAPLLLTGRDRLPTVVAEELARLRVRTVWILGGESAVSADVEQSLRDMGYGIRRLAGTSRYATAREIAAAAGPSLTGEVVLALGEHSDPDRAWPDAVASGALAATPDRIPTVLTRPGNLPEETVEALRVLRAREIIIAGGGTVISPRVESQLEDLGYRVRRIGGNSRYDTSVALATEALSRFPDGARPAVFASGRAYPDALSAGSLAASLGAPLLLVPPSDALPRTSERFLRDNAERLGSGVMVGGPMAADDHVIAQLDAALQGEPAPVAASQPQALATDGAADAQSDETPSGDVAPGEVGHTFTGQASWYGPGFEGNPTASGEPFDPAAMTTAHRTLAFGTVLRVTNLGNGKVVEVRVNDRGPFSDDRVLDLSQGAAEVLGMVDDGVAEVRAEVVSTGY